MRKLTPELKNFFDSKFFGEGVITPQPFIDKNDPRKMLLLTSLACEGVIEEGADNHGTVVEMFQKAINNTVHHAWCLSFILSCVAYVESFNFKSEIPDSEHVLTFYNLSTTKPLAPLAGDIICWRLGNTLNGHAGIITNTITKSQFETIEGNTGPGSGIVRNGDGVYRKKRNLDTIKTFNLLGFVRPFI